MRALFWTLPQNLVAMRVSQPVSPVTRSITFAFPLLFSFHPFGFFVLRGHAPTGQIFHVMKGVRSIQLWCTCSQLDHTLCKLSVCSHHFSQG